MEIKLLPKSVRETLRSEINFRSVAKCVAQLVYNSLDAKSDCIAVRINLVTFKIQVIDNGTGITKRNLKIIGYRYATSKYYTIEDLEKNPNMFPSRGECLASIIKLSETVKITSRYLDNAKTYCKTFENGKSLSLTSDKHRPSKGTTIIIENFMYNLPVRKKTINHNCCLEEIKIEIENIALMHPKTSFSFRNDANGEIMFEKLRTTLFQTVTILHGKEFSGQLRKVALKNGKFIITGLIRLESHSNNRIQYVYINNRFVSKTKIHELINKIISRSKIIKNNAISNSPIVKQKYAAYIVNIKCSNLELDIVDFIEPEIEFKNWDIILSTVEEAVTSFLKKYDLLITKETNKNRYQNGSPLTESTPKIRTSLVSGVIRGIPMKRKLPEQIEQSLSTEKSGKTEERKVLNLSHKKPTPEKIEQSLSSDEKEKLYSFIDLPPPLKKMRKNPETKENVTLEKNKRGRKKKQNKETNKKQVNHKDVKEKENISLDKYKKLNLKNGKNKYNFFTSNFDSPPKKQLKINENKNETNVNSEMNNENEVIYKPSDIPNKKYNNNLLVLGTNKSIETNEQLNVTLESKSDFGKQLIMEKFLKSTAIYRTDDDLKDDYLSFESAEKYTNRSNTCYVSSMTHCKTKSTSTKISITETFQQFNIDNNMKQVNQNQDNFKIPKIPIWRKRKSSSISSHDSVSNILAQFKPKNDKNVSHKNLPKNFKNEFLNNISKNNNYPSKISNQVLEIIDSFNKESNNNKLECTITITKTKRVLQSSEFINPAKNINRKFAKPYQKFNNVGSRKIKDIVHSHSMLKTFYDLKNTNHNFKPKNYKNYHLDKYKFYQFVPNVNRNYLSYKNNNEPLSSSLKKEISTESPNNLNNESVNKCLPIFNLQRSKHQKNNFKPKNFYCNFNNSTNNNLLPSSNICEQKPSEKYNRNIITTTTNENNIFSNFNSFVKPRENQNTNSFTNVKFPSPVVSFEPYKSNPHLEKLFSKNQTTYSKPNFAFSVPNFNIPEYFDKKSNNKSEYSFIPTYDSHQVSKESLLKQNVETKNKFPKNDDLLINKVVDYFKLTSNTKLFELLNRKNKCEKTESSSLTFLSEEKEVPETPKTAKNVEINKVENKNGQKSELKVLSDEKEIPETPKTVKNVENNKIENKYGRKSKLKSKITPRDSSEDKYYNTDNITKWIHSITNITSDIEDLDLIENINTEDLSLKNNVLKDSKYFSENVNNTIENVQNCTPIIKNIKKTNEIPSITENNKNMLTNKYGKQNNDNKNNDSLLQKTYNEINIVPSEISKIFFKSLSLDNETNKKLETINNNENILTNLSQKSLESTKSNGPKMEFNFLPLNKSKNIFNNFKFDFMNTDNKSSSKKTIIFSSPEPKEISDNDKILSPLIDKEKFVLNSLDNKKISIEEKQVSEKENSPVLFTFESNPISALQNDVNSKQNITIGFDENKSITKQDQLHISLSNFSPASNLIQEKDITDLINVIDESIVNDQNCLPSIVVGKESETNTKFPEDCSNVVIENNRNIDQKLNNSNFNNECNSYEILNNSLSKNCEESKEINQIVEEKVNGMSEWVKQTTDGNSNLYINSRTGMTSFLTPKEVEGCAITKRPDYMPKGMSPILKKSTIVTKELSQNSKNVLHKTIANTENDELQTVKWINYFENKDSDNFFNDLYSNCKHYESEIANINNYAIPKKIVKGFENYSFSKEDFNNITVINQCDNKFIITKMEIQGKYDLLVMFDQHAVHERIRLEKLLKDYEEKENRLKSVKCLKSIKFTVDNFEIKMLNIYKQNFENWGFTYETKENNVKFTHIPSCWQMKDDSNIKTKDYSTIENLIRALIQEESNWLKSIRRINMALPLVIINTIKTEACKNAIKFGDPLTKEQCENLIKELFLCDLPFNCAHGRPTLYPVIDLNNLKNLNNEEEEIINLSKLKKSVL